MMIGYARVSTDDQRLDLQRDALIKSGVPEDKIYQEHVSGVKTKRPQLEECLKSLRRGDMLVIWRLDRLGRSLVELVKLSQLFEKQGVELKSLSESIDTSSAAGKMIFNVFAAVAQFERDLISERTRAGLKAARARGHKGGRKPKMTAKQIKLAKIMLSDPTIVHQEVADACGVSRATLYRTLARVRQEEEAGQGRVKLKKPQKRRVGFAQPSQ